MFFIPVLREIWLWTEGGDGWRGPAAMVYTAGLYPLWMKEKPCPLSETATTRNAPTVERFRAIIKERR
ncbi:hypothetical protein DXT74_11190 [Chromobacterium sp. Rain0013]|nr:hypothetical protein DXT74_11190 [Chromobacterium sp. Rain0013]